MVDEVPTDQRAAYVQERQMNVGATLIANTQAAVAIEPGERALDHPTMLAESFAALNAAPRDTWRNRTLAQLFAQGLRVIRLISMQLLRTLARSAAPTSDRFNRILLRRTLLF